MHRNRQGASASPSPSNPSSSSPGGTHYFNHYPSNFLKPYGLANPPPDHEMLMRRTKPVSCEWLKRPKIAMSEFSSTMTENMAWLGQCNNPMLNNDHLHQLNQQMQPLLQSLAPFNTRSPNGNPQPEHARTMLEEIYDDTSSVHQSMMDMFQIGGSMFIMGIQYMLVRDLLSNPEEFADRSVGTDPQTTTFKRERSVHGLLNYITSTCCGSTRTGGPETVTRNLLDQLRAVTENAPPAARAPAPNVNAPQIPPSQLPLPLVPTETSNVQEHLQAQLAEALAELNEVRRRQQEQNEPSTSTGRKHKRITQPIRATISSDSEQEDLPTSSPDEKKKNKRKKTPKRQVTSQDTTKTIEDITIIEPVQTEQEQPTGKKSKGKKKRQDK